MDQDSEVKLTSCSVEESTTLIIGINENQPTKNLVDI